MSMKLNVTDGIIRDIRLGNIKKVAPKRDFVITTSSDKFSRLKIDNKKITLVLHDFNKKIELENLSLLIASEIILNDKFKGAFSENGINLYCGNYFAYSFDGDGNKIKEDVKFLEEGNW